MTTTELERWAEELSKRVWAAACNLQVPAHTHVRMRPDIHDRWLSYWNSCPGRLNAPKVLCHGFSVSRAMDITEDFQVMQKARKP